MGILKQLNTLHLTIPHTSHLLPQAYAWGFEKVWPLPLFNT